MLLLYTYFNPHDLFLHLGSCVFGVRNITVIANTHAFQPHSASQYCHQTLIFVISEKSSVSSVQARKEQEAVINRQNTDSCGFSHPFVNTSLFFGHHLTKISFACPLCLSNRSQRSHGYNFHGNYDQVIYSSDENPKSLMQIITVLRPSSTDSS